MPSDGFFKTAEFYTLKGAQRDLIRLAGGIDRAALVSGLSTATIGRFNDRHAPDLMPMYVVVRLEADVREPVVSRAAVLMAGGEVSMSNEDTGGPTLSRAFAEVVTEDSELYAAYLQAAEDGTLTTAELWSVRPKIVDARRAADHLLAAVERGIAASSLKSVAEA